MINSWMATGLHMDTIVFDPEGALENSLPDISRLMDISNVGKLNFCSIGFGDPKANGP